MVSLIEAARAPAYPAEIVLVLANRPGAGGLARAESAGIATRLVDHKAYPDRAAFEAALDEALREAGIELVCLAGFMRVLTDGFVRRWSGRLLNVHPSLLPAYKGLHTHARALADGVERHGCTVHHVVAELDSGPVIRQASVPVLPGDTEESLAARVLGRGAPDLPEALAEVAAGLGGGSAA